MLQLRAQPHLPPAPEPIWPVTGSKANLETAERFNQPPTDRLAEGIIISLRAFSTQSSSGSGADRHRRAVGVAAEISVPIT